MQTFQFIALTPAPLVDPAIAIAASRAGALGVLNLEHAQNGQAARKSIAELAHFADGELGIKFDSRSPQLIDDITEELPEKFRFLILTSGHLTNLSQQVPDLRQQGFTVLVEVTDMEQADFVRQLGADGLIAKGNEASGWVGQETTFILLQHLLSRFDIPVWAFGGIGLHTAAACYAAGAAGVVLDSQLALTRESRLPQAVKTAVAAMDGSETICLGAELGCSFRAYRRPGAKMVDALSEQAIALANATLANTKLANMKLVSEAQAADQHTTDWYRSVHAVLGWGPLEESIWPLGQDAAFARPLADRYHTVGGIISAMRQKVRAQVQAAHRLRPLAADSPLAQSHHTLYPIVQGPMTRVSDRAEFALRVAESGGLPFLALSLMRAPEVESLLQETVEQLGDLSWGVGILGFVPLALRREQLEVIRQIAPPFALIAGGRPDQARTLEEAGIPTYLHVPSPGLLRLFLKDGARRFVFEGWECGGHVGPRSSFVLWNTMVDILLEEVADVEAQECHVLFAGGIQDRLSAAMVATLAAPLAERGMRIGVLMGTAYLFTEEAVATGSIMPGFQEEALNCERTILLESGPGHSTRCVPSQFASIFQQEKRRLQQEGRSSEEIRNALETLNVGRLRIASKGITRHPEYGADPDAPKYAVVNSQAQHDEGLYMIGQVAALRDKTCTLAELHHEVAVESDRLLEHMVKADRLQVVGEPARPSQVAIIGMSALLPKAGDMTTFWANVLNGVNAITEVPETRWDASLYYDSDRNARDKIYSKAGGFLDDLVFDPLEFGIPPKSLPSIDPLQLLALVAARDALADAGYDTRPFDRSRTSVILGASGGTGDLGANYLLRAGLPRLFGEAGFEIAEKAEGSLPTWTEDSFSGLLLNVVAGRIANRMDLGGLNYVVDAACASSLTATHLAVKELETNNTDMVIVGGVDTVQNPFGYLCFSKTQALSPSGEARVFDATGDGIVISEGVVMLILKRLADAERDGDRIYAVISAVAGSSDGRAMGMTAPRPEGQVLALERAYRKAGFSPATVGLFEAHGTGTVVGDRTEAISLARFLAKKGARPHSHAIGSVKSMVGHTKATAGVAGLAKMAAALYHKVLPPTLGVTQPNPKAGFDDGPLYVNSETRPWIQGVQRLPRRAGVSAFGFGGTNFHAVVEEYTGDFLGERRPAVLQEWPSELFMWSADSRQHLLAAVSSLADALNEGANPNLRDLAYSLWQKSQEMPPGNEARLVIVARSLADLQKLLKTAVDGIRKGGSAAGGHTGYHDPRGAYFSQAPLAKSGKIAFLFPGQGSQYPNMLRDLAIHFTEVRETFERADRTLATSFPEPLSSYIFPIPAFTPEARRAQQQALTATNVAQPALGASNLALLRLLRSFGLRPELTAGHSYGEYVALFAAGVVDEELLLRLSEARGRIIIEAAENDLGTMAAVRSDADTVRSVVDRLSDVWIANLNAPEQTIISGSRQGVASAVSLFQEQGIQAQSISVACAFHSPLVAPAQQRLAQMLAQTKMAPPAIEVFANATSEAYPSEPEAIQALLAEQLVRPVRFLEQIEAMYAAGARLFVEVGPGRTLTNLTGRILGERPHAATATDSPGQHGITQLQQALAQLIVHGVPVNLDRLFAGRETRLLNLEALVEETTGDTPPATAWLVNGSRARPFDGPPDMPAKPPVTLMFPDQDGNLTRLATATEDTASTRAPIPPEKSDAPQAVLSNGEQPDDEVAQVMLQFQQTMDQFLETQRQVMISYLQSGPPAGRESGRTTEAFRDARPAIQGEGTRPTPEEGVIDPVVSKPDGADHDPGREKESAQPQEGSALPTRAELTQLLLQIVSDRTGYPPEMLDMDVDIEASLGIDSIKRVEILGALQSQSLPPDVQLSSEMMEELSSIKTLSGVVDWLDQALHAGSDEDLPGHSVAEYPENLVEVQPGRRHPEPEAARPSKVARYLLSLVDAPSLPETEPALTLDADRVLLVTDDGRGIASTLVTRVREWGGQAVLLRVSGEKEDGIILADLADPQSVSEAIAAIRKQHGPIGGIVHLQPLQDSGDWQAIDQTGWRNRLRREVKGLFYLIRESAVDLNERRPAWVVAATNLGQARGESSAFPGQAGISGLLKSLALEWPDVTCKTIHLDATEAPQALANRLLREMMARDGLVEISYRGSQRQEVRPVPAPLGPEVPINLSIDSDWVILVSGGARGITAEVALELASRYQPTLLLLGRSAAPAPQEGLQTNGLSSPRELKAALMAQMSRNGETVPLVQVEAAYNQLLKEREIRRNLRRLQRTGSTVRYIQADVRDETAMTQLIESIYGEHGRLDGVIHGAGIIEDKLLTQKTPESFDRVFDTKADSAFILSRALRADSLKFLTFFTSAAGTFGNRGQSDYAATNEVVNWFARYLDRRWPGRIIALNWGPWQKKGMVSPELQREFAKRQIELIPIAEGCRMLDRELRFGKKGDVRVVIGGGAWGDASALDTPPQQESARTPGVSSPGVETSANDRVDDHTAPLLRSASVPTLNGSRVEIMRDLDMTNDLYLQHHKLDGNMVFPVAMAMELMAEAVQSGWPDMEVAGLRDLQVLNGIIVEDNPVSVRIIAQGQTQARHDRQGVDAHVQIVDEKSRRPHYRAVVEMVSSLPPAPVYQPPAPGDLRPFPMTVATAYQQWLFHGPVFQGIDRIQGISPHQLVATCLPSSPQMCLAGEPGGQWLIDPVVFDSALQMIILWMRHYRDSTPLPSRFSHYHRYGSLSQSPITCYLTVPDDASDQLLEVDIAFVNMEGRLVGMLEKMECPASKAFNRLAGSRPTSQPR